jgi:dipeptidyl aminopeptidase/acylaminoacyl peptidase
VAFLRWPVVAAVAALTLAWVGLGVLHSPDEPQGPPPLTHKFVTSFWSIPVAGGTPTLVFRTRGWQDERATYRSDGSIVFRRWTSFGKLGLFSRTRDGKVRKLRSLSPSRPPAVWSADGKTTAFAGQARRLNGYRPELVVVRLGRKRVVRLAGAPSPVALAPHGDQLLFSWGNQSFLLDTKTGRRRLFANEAGPAAWSPDGRAIAYVDREGLVVRFLRTGRRKVLLRGRPGTVGTVESFSPDGRTILYVKQELTKSAQLPS